MNDIFMLWCECAIDFDQHVQKPKDKQRPSNFLHKKTQVGGCRLEFLWWVVSVI
jgi:hypothetical protein